MDENKNFRTSPSPVTSRTRGMYKNIRAMVRIKLCVICDFQAHSLTALRHHMMSHTPSRVRFLVEPGQCVPGGNRATGEAWNRNESKSVGTGENPAPITLDDLASQLGAIFSPGKAADKVETPVPPVVLSSETAPVPPTGTDPSTPQPLVEESILDMLLGSQPETLPEASPQENQRNHTRQRLKPGRTRRRCHRLSCWNSKASRGGTKARRPPQGCRGHGEKALAVPDQSDRDDFQSQKPRSKRQHRRGRRSRKREHVHPPITTATMKTKKQGAKTPATNAKTTERITETPAGGQTKKKIVCEFCGKKFASQLALRDHAESVHNVEDEMTFAFESHKRELSRPATPPPTTVEATVPKTLVGCYDSEGPVRAKWCQHCARELLLGISLAEHIRIAHNDSFVKKNEGLQHTSVIEVQAEDIVDPSQRDQLSTTVRHGMGDPGERCSFCEKGFPCQADLDTHLVQVHDVGATDVNTSGGEMNPISPPYKRDLQLLWADLPV
ncbi:hypothetical protein TNIN_142211, partial [Trichonephila inaurata madagascariensis]